MAKLGATYIDKITGFKGVCTGYVQYITGCNQLLLAPRIKADGGLDDGRWFDEQRCDVVKSVDVVTIDAGTAPGFDTPAPKC